MERENLLKLPQSSPFSLFYFSISMSLSLQEGETLSGVDHEEDRRSANKLYLLIVMGPIDCKHFGNKVFGMFDESSYGCIFC